MRKQRGFSLIELVVAMGVMITLIAMSVPLIQGMMRPGFFAGQPGPVGPPGTSFVPSTNSIPINDLANVNISSSPNANDVVAFDAATGQWVNQQPVLPTATSTYLSISGMTANPAVSSGAVCAPLFSPSNSNAGSALDCSNFSGNGWTPIQTVGTFHTLSAIISQGGTITSGKTFSVGLYRSITGNSGTLLLGGTCQIMTPTTSCTYNGTSTTLTIGYNYYVKFTGTTLSTADLSVAWNLQ